MGFLVRVDNNKKPPMNMRPTMGELFEHDGQLCMVVRDDCNLYQATNSYVNIVYLTGKHRGRISGYSDRIGWEQVVLIGDHVIKPVE